MKIYNVYVRVYAQGPDKGIKFDLCEGGII